MRARATHQLRPQPLLVVDERCISVALLCTAAAPPGEAEPEAMAAAAAGAGEALVWREAEGPLDSLATGSLIKGTRSGYFFS